MSLISIRMIPTVALVIPFFVIIRTFDYYLIQANSNFHFYDTKINLIILYVTFILGFVIWIMRGFFLTIPSELEEAARIDGCTRTQALIKIVLPLSAPGLVATGIFTSGFVASLPPIILALIFQKFLIKGLTAGSIKG